MKLYLEVKALVLDVSSSDVVIRLGRLEWYFIDPEFDEYRRSRLEQLVPQKVK